MRRYVKRTRPLALVSLIVLALVSVGLVLVAGGRSSVEAGHDPKVYVCKYVGQPGVDERLQTGQNPIEVSVNATGGTAVGSYFADQHGRSYVLGVVPMDPEPTAANCPPPDVPEFGRVEITKVVAGEAAPDDMVFEISLTPAGGGAITKSITGSGMVVFGDLEPGVYTLSESDPGSNWTVEYSSTSITVKVNETAKATITNTYTPPVEPELGRVEVTKAVRGEGAPDDVVFEISLVPESGAPITKTVTGAGAITFDGLEPGIYTVVESDPGPSWTVSYSPETVTVVGAQTEAVTVTNSYSPPAEPELGRVEVTKAVVGEGAPDDMVFEISLTPQGGSAITKSITGAGVIAFEDLEPGVYALSEKDPGSDWTVAYSSASITVLAGDTARATVTNTYTRQVVPPELGSVVVTKVVTGEPPAATYQIGLVGPAPATTERWLTVAGSGQVTFSGLPIGSYTVVERDPGEAYAVTISPTWLDVTNGGVVNVTVTNAYAEQESAPPTVPPTTVAGAGGQSTTTAPVSGQSLPHTGAEGGLAAVALSLVAGGTALAAISRRRQTA